MKKIAIVGCGSIGHALAALLAQKGHEVYLTDASAYADMLNESARIGTIRLAGFARGEGTPPESPATWPARWARPSSLSAAPSPTGTREVARMIAPPYLDESKSVLIGAGNCGSLVYRKVFDAYGRSGVLLGEVGGNFFPCRLSEDRTATIGLPLGPKAIAAFPPRDTPAWRRPSGRSGSSPPAKSILLAAFNGPNLITHPAGAVLNAAAIENSGGAFNLFQDGVSPGFIRLVDRLWEEKRSVFEALGFTPRTLPGRCSRAFWTSTTRPTATSARWADPAVCTTAISPRTFRCSSVCLSPWRERRASPCRCMRAWSTSSPPSPGTTSTPGAAL